MTEEGLKLVTILSEGTRKTETVKLKKGNKHYRYNPENSKVETIFIQEDCLIDQILVWNKDDQWEAKEYLWKTLRPIPPPEPKPPGFLRRLLIRLFRRTKLPRAKLLKG
jgi:hypothetical protein